MPVKVDRNPKESTDRMISRFNKAVQKSRKLLYWKEHRYFKKPKTKRQLRQAAVVRERYRREKEKQKYT